MAISFTMTLEVMQVPGQLEQEWSNGARSGVVVGAIPIGAYPYPTSCNRSRNIACSSRTNGDRFNSGSRIDPRIFNRCLDRTPPPGHNPTGDGGLESTAHRPDRPGARHAA